MSGGPKCVNDVCEWFDPASCANNCSNPNPSAISDCYNHILERGAPSGLIESPTAADSIAYAAAGTRTPPVGCDTKKDVGKPPVALTLQNFPRAIAEISRVVAFGDSGPGRSPGSWRTIPHFKTRYQSAKARHAISGLVDDGGVDGDSGLLHLAHEAWNVLALLEKAMEAEDDPR